MLIDNFLPNYDLAERTCIEIHAPIERVYAVVSSLDMSSSTIICWFFRLRGLPRSALSLQGMQRMGFNVLGQVQNQEMLLGLVGRFWKLRGDLQPVDALHFRNFSKEGFVKAVWNFTLLQRGNGTVHLSTETRVFCNDSKSRTFFCLYWLVIALFSKWIRREILRLIKADAEKLL